MLKRIWMPFLALAIASCSSDLVETQETQESNVPKPGFVMKYSNTGQVSLQDYAFSRAIIHKEISLIMDEEELAGHEFGEKIENQVENAASLDAYRSVLISDGISIKSADRIVTLINQDLSNFDAFLEDNPDFIETNTTAGQNKLFGKAFAQVLEENPEIFPPYDNANYSDPARLCRAGMNNKLKDCYDDVVIYGAAALFLSVASGGLASGVALGVLVVKATKCERAAKRDYRLCMAQAGQAL